MQDLVLFILLAILLSSCTFTTYDITTEPKAELIIPIKTEEVSTTPPNSISETLYWLLHNEDFDPQFEKKYDLLLDAALLGDLDLLYTRLSPHPFRSNVREISVYGVPDAGQYRFALGSNSPKQMGESQIRIQLQQQDPRHYILQTSLEVFFKEQDVYTLPRVLDQFYQNLIQPNENQQFQAGLRSRNDTETLWRIKKSYPYLYEFIREYITFFSLTDPEKEIPQKMDISGTLNWTRLERHYPNLVQWLKKFRRILNSHIMLKDKEDNILTYFNTNSREFLLRSIFAVDFDGLVPMQSLEQIGANYGQKIQNLQDYHFNAEFLLDADVLGLQIIVKDLKAKLHLNLTPEVGKLTYQFLPDCTVEVKGNFFYFLPKTMIDALIPSNIEELIRQFIEEMIREQGVQGGLVIRKVENGYLWKTYTRQNLLNNGFLKVAANFVRLKFNLTPTQRQEFQELFLRLVCAFEAISYEELQQKNLALPSSSENSD